MEVGIEQAPLVEMGQGSEKMLAPQEVQKMLALSALGWGAKRISRELGCSRNTVREYLRRGGWRPMDVSARASALEPHKQWLAERLRRHRDNADVVRHTFKAMLEVVQTISPSAMPDPEIAAQLNKAETARAHREQSQEEVRRAGEASLQKGDRIRAIEAANWSPQFRTFGSP